MICTKPNVIRVDYDHPKENGNKNTKFFGHKEWLAVHEYEDIATYNKMNASLGKNIVYYRVPCNQCRFCRINRAYEWTNRIMLEASQCKDIWFLTLTYRDEDLPKANKWTHEGETYINPRPDTQGYLEPKDLTDFWKRLRKNLKLKDFKYFACGEYGPNGTHRPHYHAIVMNLPIIDLMQIKGTEMYHSQEIEDIWKKGFISIRTVNEDAIQYVTRYILKKQNGDDRFIDCYLKEGKYCKEFQRQSTGLGRNWYEENKMKIYQVDENGNVIHDEVSDTEARVIIKKIKYFDSLFQDENPKVMEKIKQHREMTAELREKAMMSGLTATIAEHLQVVEAEQIERMRQALIAKNTRDLMKGKKRL